MAVLGDHVLVEERERVLGRGGGQADERGVEVLQNLPPQAVDRAVGLVHHDHVEELGRDRLRVDDRRRLADQRRARPRKRRALLQLAIELRVALEDAVEPLNGGDDDPVHRVHRLRGQAGDVVQLGELPTIVGRRVGLKLLLGLLAQVAAVHQEQGPPRAAKLHQPIQRRDRGVRLAAARRHLDQRPRATGLDRGLEVLDRIDLRRPHTLGVQRRRELHPAQERGGRGCARPLLFQGDRPGEPRLERLGLVKPEHPTAARRRVEQVGEPRLHPRGLVQEGQRADRDRDLRGEAVGVVLGLRLDPREGCALFLGLDDPRRLLVHVQQVVREPCVRLELPDRHAQPRGHVHLVPALHHPPGLRQGRVDVLASALLGLLVGVRHPVRLASSGVAGIPLPTRPKRHPTRFHLSTDSP